MKIAYEQRNFKAETPQIINRADVLLHEYAQKGYEVTLRQLYYRLVARGWLDNHMREYKRLGSIMSNARMAGLIDWNHLVDRTRNIDVPATWSTPESLLQVCANSYAVDRWATQPNRVEVWVEKDALINVIEKGAEPWQCPTFSCRGYTSQSSMWQAGERLYGYAENEQTPIIIHLGDHDPSGIDMTRDICDRLETFMGGLDVNRIALNMDQIQRLGKKLPPYPAKMTDSRARGYVLEFGYDSWELDALEPDHLTRLIREAIENYVDMDKWDEAMEREQEGIDYLQALANKEEGED
ncbi:hypothetical protein LCGC14_1457750 [marine sediment metagenome]|uniref:DUF2399 domain-containing protein n=1 Tax=marine sediment metagenome TaxID=412755 RepID=A0A0F9MHW4_9ZZZZ